MLHPKQRKNFKLFLSIFLEFDYGSQVYDTFKQERRFNSFSCLYIQYVTYTSVCVYKIVIEQYNQTTSE